MNMNVMNMALPSIQQKNFETTPMTAKSIILSTYRGILREVKKQVIEQASRYQKMEKLITTLEVCSKEQRQIVDRSSHRKIPPECSYNKPLRY